MTSKALESADAIRRLYPPRTESAMPPERLEKFKGFIAQAYHVGTATGSDGKRYSLETDIRAYQGEYVAADGSHQRGTFALL